MAVYQYWKAKYFTCATVDHVFNSHQIWWASRWGERKLQNTKHQSSNYFYSPDAIAKIPRSNCYFGKLATPRNNFCLQGCRTLVDRMMGKSAAFREISSAAPCTTKCAHISNQRERTSHNIIAPCYLMQVGFSVSHLLFRKETSQISLYKHLFQLIFT